MVYSISKIELDGKALKEVGSMFLWKETVIPTKAQMIQKSIQYLVKAKAESGKYMVECDQYSLTFDFVKRQ